MKTEDVVNYFRFIEQALDGLSSRSSGSGVYGWSAAANLGKILKCRNNPNNGLCSEYPCGKCQVCMEQKAYRSMKKYERRFPDSGQDPCYLITLSLPKQVQGLAKVVKGERFGELFFVTKALGGMKLEDVLRKIRDAAIDAVLSCCSDMVPALVYGVHLDDGLLVFSPHLHIVLCPVGFDRKAWPFNKDASKSTIRDAWRRVIGGTSGRPMRKFRRNLLEEWAARLSKASREIFCSFQSGFKAGVVTTNLAYRHFAGGQQDMAELEKAVRLAVMADGHCADVKRLVRDMKENMRSPEVAFRRAVKYALMRQEKGLEYEARGGYVLAKQNVRGKAKSQSCGPLSLQYRRLAQLHSLRRFRASSPRGWVAIRNRGLRELMRDVVSEGYRKKTSSDGLCIRKPCDSVPFKSSATFGENR